MHFNYNRNQIHPVNTVQANSHLILGKFMPPYLVTFEMWIIDPHECHNLPMILKLMYHLVKMLFQRIVSKGKAVQCVFRAEILTTPLSNINPPMPLDVDTGLPGVELWFGLEKPSEIGLLYHLDLCAAMNTGNLHVHQWLITTHPHLVAEYIQYDDATPFQPLQLACAVRDLDTVKSMYGKLTAVVRYCLRYAVNGKRFTLSFGLGVDVAVNSIVGLPTLRQWGGTLDFNTNKFVATKLNRQFPLYYEPTKQGLPQCV